MQAWPQTTRGRGDLAQRDHRIVCPQGQQHVGVGVVGTVNAGAGGGADDVDQQQGRDRDPRAATGRLRRAACASHGAGRSRNRRARRGPARSRGTAGRPRCRARRRETRSGRPPAHRGRSTRGRGSADEWRRRASSPDRSRAAGCGRCRCATTAGRKGRHSFHHRGPFVLSERRRVFESRCPLVSSTVAMMDKPFTRRTALMKGLFEGIEGQLRVQ